MHVSRPRTCGFIRLSFSALSSSLPSDPVHTPSVLGCTLAFAEMGPTRSFLSGSTLTTT